VLIIKVIGKLTEKSITEEMMNIRFSSENLFGIQTLPIERPFIDIMQRNPQEERKLLDTSHSWSLDSEEDAKDNQEASVRIYEQNDTNSINYNQRAGLLGIMTDSTDSISPPNVMAPIDDIHDLFQLQRLMDPSISSSDSSESISSDITYERRNNEDVKFPNPPKLNYNQISKEDVKKILTCHICFGYMSAGNNAMCIYCSKTYCKACLVRSLSTTRKCPN
jgi:hypothetical protein